MSEQLEAPGPFVEPTEADLTPTAEQIAEDDAQVAAWVQEQQATRLEYAREAADILKDVRGNTPLGTARVGAAEIIALATYLVSGPEAQA